LFKEVMFLDKSSVATWENRLLTGVNFATSAKPKSSFLVIYIDRLK